MLCGLAMIRAKFIHLCCLAGLAATVSSCASSSDRYPSLATRDFERVQGQFAAPSGDPLPTRPAPLSIESTEQIEASLADARSRHDEFLTLLGKAQPIVREASGASPNDNRWSVAMVEIASLDSHLSVTTGILAQLDALYADASLGFEERTTIETARGTLAEMVETEQQAVNQLVELLASPTAPSE